MIRLLPILLIVYLTTTGKAASAIGELETGSDNSQQRKSVSEGLPGEGKYSEGRDGVVLEEDDAVADEEELGIEEDAPILETRAGRNNRAGGRGDGTGNFLNSGGGVRKTSSTAPTRRTGLTLERTPEGASDIERRTQERIERLFSHPEDEIREFRRIRMREGESQAMTYMYLKKHRNAKEEAGPSRKASQPPPTTQQKDSVELVTLAANAVLFNADQQNIRFLNSALDNFQRLHGHPLIDTTAAQLATSDKARSALMAASLAKQDHSKREKKDKEKKPKIPTGRKGRDKQSQAGPSEGQAKPTKTLSPDEKYSVNLVKMAANAVLFNPNEENVQFFETSLENFLRANDRHLIDNAASLSPQDKARSALTAATLIIPDEEE